MLLFRILLSILFLIIILDPEKGWRILEGWKFKNAEPSKAYLIVARIAAVILLIAVWATAAYSITT